MPVRDDFKPGEFCWIDHNAHDMKAAAAWYADLFGWQVAEQETPGGGPPYAFFMKGRGATAGLGQMMEEMKAQGIPPLWNSYVAVDDCGATEDKARAIGATITVPTMEIPDFGKLCFLLDDQGASIALWQELGCGPGVCVGEPSSLCWNELMCRDIDKARSFYGALFGWEFVDRPKGGMSHSVIQNQGADAGGLMVLDGPQFEGIPCHWMVYFQVEDCESATRRVTETGGCVRVPPTQIEIGQFSTVTDPHGGGFSMIQRAPRDG